MQTAVLVYSSYLWRNFNMYLKELADSTSALNKNTIGPWRAR